MSKIYSRTRIKVPKIFISKVGEKKFKNKKKVTITLVIAIIAFSTIRIVLNAILPTFNNICEDKGKSIATIISNEQATAVMAKHKYDELFTIEKDNSGNITMIKSNVGPINEIISDVAVKIQDEINKKGSDNVKIALGTFSRATLLSGRGPKVPIKVMSIGNVETDLRSEFSSQGINQTLHRVYLQVDCQITILTPFEDISTKISNQILIAENVIIGKIPESYYNMEGIDRNDTIEFID